MYTVPKIEDYSPEALKATAAELLDALQLEIFEPLQKGRQPDVKALRDRWLGRKNGILTQVNEWLKVAPTDKKRDVGQIVNKLKGLVEGLITREHGTLSVTMNVRSGRELLEKGLPEPSQESPGLMFLRQHRLEHQRVDITLPGIHRPLGAEHPVIRTMSQIVSVFRAMGYSIGEGPEIESDYYNFEALNFPPNHPARDTQDTIFIAGQEKRPQRDRLLLRTHTSPVQIRTMEKQAPPVRIVIPGRVHRNDAPDASHSPMFHQVEGLAVDEGITFCDLKGTIDHAMKAFFGSQVRTRFQPSFFPFTEPSAEVSISCIFCGGSGCRVCKQSGWIELLGCGMVDPALYNFVGYDASKVSGFAFGMGVERIAMLMYGVDDIQLFYQGDVRFLEQFA